MRFNHTQKDLLRDPVTPSQLVATVFPLTIQSSYILNSPLKEAFLFVSSPSPLGAQSRPERGVSGWHLILTVGVEWEWEWSLFSKEEDTGSMASSFQAFGKPQ